MRIASHGVVDREKILRLKYKKRKKKSGEENVKMQKEEEEEKMRSAKHYDLSVKQMFYEERTNYHQDPCCYLASLVCNGIRSLFVELLFLLNPFSLVPYTSEYFDMRGDT